MVTSFKFKDIYAGNRCQPEFTYYKNDYAARLDRIYLNKLFNCIQEIKTQPASFSDHLYVSVTLQISSQIKIGRPRWKLNTSLLQNTSIKQNFLVLWTRLQHRKMFYTTISAWWNDLVKPEVKKYFAAKGKEANKLKYGLLEYLEFKLRKQYEIANTSGVINNFSIKSLKTSIDSVRDDMVKGVKIRSRLQDAIHGENISNYLIAKQKEIASRKIITTLTSENGAIFDNHQDILECVKSFYYNLYSKFN